MIYPSMPLVAFIACVACCKLALKLLNNVGVSLLTWSSVLTYVLLVIHAPYHHAIAILSFIFMPSCCWLTSHGMKCYVVSGSSSPTCLLIVVSAMNCYFHCLNLFMELAMFTWVPSYLLCLFGSCAVRDFCSMQLVDSCHAFVCYDMFL